MGKESHSIPYSHLLSEGYEEPHSRKISFRTSNLEMVHNTIVRFCAAITAHTYVPASATILGVFSLQHVDNYLESFTGAITTVIALSLFILALAALGVSILRFSDWTQAILRQYWNLSTFPFSVESEKILQSPLKSQFHFVVSLILSDKRATLNGRPSRTFRVAVTQTMIGTLFVSVGILCTAFAIEFGIVEDNTFSTEISILSAFVSVLLGRTLGVVALSTFSAASSWIDLALLAGIILFPATMLAPASGNFVNGMESILNQRFTDNYGGYRSPLLTSVLLAFTVVSSFAFSSVIWAIYQAI